MVPLLVLLALAALTAGAPPSCIPALTAGAPPSCIPAPKFPAPDPVSRAANISVVALTRAVNPWSFILARSMNNIQQKIASRGVSFAMVNRDTWIDRTTLNTFNYYSVDFPVIQDSVESGIWSKLDGITGDVFIFDRCQRLVTRLNSPTEQQLTDAILGMCNNSPCGKCNKPGAQRRF